MSRNSEDGNLVEAIIDKYESGQELTNQEALAFLPVVFSNATNGNYEPEKLFEDISTSFSITIKKQ